MAISTKFIFFTLLITLYACNTNFEEAELLGTYKANHGKGEDIIYLKKNGEYLHIFKSSKKTYKENGTWGYETFQNEPMISFYNFNHRWRYEDWQQDPEVNESPETIKNIWPAHVERSLFGKIRLGLDDDMGYYFEKVEK